MTRRTNRTELDALRARLCGLLGVPVDPSKPHGLDLIRAGTTGANRYTLLRLGADPSRGYPYIHDLPPMQMLWHMQTACSSLEIAAEERQRATKPVDPEPDDLT